MSAHCGTLYSEYTLCEHSHQHCVIHHAEPCLTISEYREGILHLQNKRYRHGAGTEIIHQIITLYLARDWSFCKVSCYEYL